MWLCGLNVSVHRLPISFRSSPILLQYDADSQDIQRQIASVRSDAARQRLLFHQWQAQVAMLAGPEVRPSISLIPHPSDNSSLPSGPRKGGPATAGQSRREAPPSRKLAQESSLEVADEEDIPEEADHAASEDDDDHVKEEEEDAIEEEGTGFRAAAAGRIQSESKTLGVVLGLGLESLVSNLIF